MKPVRLVAMGLLLLGLLMPWPVQASSLDARMRQEDPRLDTPVTFAADRITIGELLERLSALSGVTVRAEEKDSASGVEVAVFLQNVPLGDALNALWSLVSYREAAWKWERSGENGAYSYFLVRPLFAKEFAEKLLAQVQEDFEWEADLLLRAARMKPEERKKLAEKNPSLQVPLTYDQIIEGLKLAEGSLSKAQRKQLLRQQAVVRLPVSALSPEGQAIVAAMVQASPTKIGLNDGSLIDAPDPEWVQFYISRSTPFIYPSLMLEIEHHGATNFIGLGQREDLTRERIMAQWLLPGDQATSPREEAKLQPGEDLPARYADHNFDQIGSLPYLRQLADRASLSLIARLPLRFTSVRSSDPKNPRRTDPAYVSGFVNRYLAQLPLRKWRTNVLLLTTTHWVLEGETETPAAERKRLARLQRQGKGIFAFRDLSETASRLTGPQLLRLSRDFPVLAYVAQWRDLFALGARYPEMASMGGARLNPEVVAALRRAAGDPAREALATAPVTAVRLIEQHRGGRITGVRSLSLQLLVEERVVAEWNTPLTPRQQN